MSLLNILWPGQTTHWFTALSRSISTLPELFLFLLAGLAFTQLHRRPREVRLFLLAIGLTLFSHWLPIFAFLPITFLNRIQGVTDPAVLTSLYVAHGIVAAVASMLLFGVVWWFVLKAAFETPASPDASENAA
jgi:hypothetical protein